METTQRCSGNLRCEVGLGCPIARQRLGTDQFAEQHGPGGDVVVRTHQADFAALNATVQVLAVADHLGHRVLDVLTGHLIAHFLGAQAGVGTRTLVDRQLNLAGDRPNAVRMLVCHRQANGAATRVSFDDDQLGAQFGGDFKTTDDLPADDVAGDASRPMTKDEVLGKFRRYAEPALGRQRVEALAAFLIEGDGAKTARQCFALASE